MKNRNISKERNWLNKINKAKSAIKQGNRTRKTSKIH